MFYMKLFSGVVRMPIRREDKELIHNLAVLGALLGACLGVFLMVHFSNRAHEKEREYTEYRQAHAALAKLSAPEGIPGELVVDQAVIKQMQEQMRATDPEVVDHPQNLWLRLPRWGFWGICGAMGIIGAATGFSTIWLTGWVGSLFIYYFIRSLYKIIRKVAPNSAAARSVNSQFQTGHSAIQRDEKRILPMVIKLVFLLMLVLTVLGAVVWHLAGIS